MSTNFHIIKHLTKDIHVDINNSFQIKCTPGKVVSGGTQGVRNSITVRKEKQKVDCRQTRIDVLPRMETLRVLRDTRVQQCVSQGHFFANDELKPNVDSFTESSFNDNDGSAINF